MKMLETANELAQIDFNHATKTQHTHTHTPLTWPIIHKLCVEYSIPTTESET